MENTHLHFVVWCAMDKVADNYSQVTYADVIALSMGEALEKAKKLCPQRRHYWVNNIVEHHNNHAKEE